MKPFLSKGRTPLLENSQDLRSTCFSVSLCSRIAKVFNWKLCGELLPQFMRYDISAGSSFFLLSEKALARLSGNEGFSQVWNEM